MTAIDVRKIAGHIGGEITGIAASPNLPPDEITVIRDALLEHKVVFLRGQRHLDDAAQAVRVHPETGERSLLLGQFVRRILGVPASDSRYLFDLFQQHMTRLENTVRWRWAPGDLAMWDNRATQHYTIDDYAGLPRTMHRVTVAGDLAVGVDGSVSRAIAGDSAAYAVPA
jgi:taurine dioxygenase